MGENLVDQTSGEDHDEKDLSREVSMMEMFDQAVRAAEAHRASMKEGHTTLVPALKGCLGCGTIAMIASPELGTCADCGAELTVLSAQQI